MADLDLPLRNEQQMLRDSVQRFLADNPRPGWRVLDACAGAGGKTLHLSAQMKNKGEICAHDTRAERARRRERRHRRGPAVHRPRAEAGVVSWAYGSAGGGGDAGTSSLPSLVTIASIRRNSPSGTCPAND